MDMLQNFHYFLVLLSCLACFITVVVGEDEYDGLYSLTVEHTFDQGLNPVFTRRGIIMVRSLKSGLGEFVEQNPLSFEKKTQLKDLAASDGLYRIRVSKGDAVNDHFVYSFMKACALYESRLSDRVSVHVDMSGNLISSSISASVPYCSGITVGDYELNQFNSTVEVQQTVLGPAPETQAYIQKLEQEKMEKAKGQQADNRGFFAKYWMYIVPLLIFMVLFQNNVDPNGGQGGGARS